MFLITHGASAEPPSTQNRISFLWSNADDLLQQKNCKKKHWEGINLDEDEVKDLKRVLPKKTYPERESNVSKLQVAVTFLHPISRGHRTRFRI